MRNSAIAPDPRLSFTGIELAYIPRDLLVKTRLFSYIELTKSKYSRATSLLKLYIRADKRKSVIHHITQHCDTVNNVDVKNIELLINFCNLGQISL